MVKEITLYCGTGFNTSITGLSTVLGSTRTALKVYTINETHETLCAGKGKRLITFEVPLRLVGRLVSP